MARNTRAAKIKAEQAQAKDTANAASQCVVCRVDNCKVTVSCAACAQRYHLSCHDPPLRRRPRGDAEWSCASCDGNDGDAKEKEDVDDEPDAPARKKRRGVSEATTKRGGADRVRVDALQGEHDDEDEDDDDESMDDSDAPLMQSTRKSNGKRPLSKAITKVASRRSVKAQDPELSFKRSSRAAARGRVAASRKQQKVVVLLTDEDEDEEDDDSDNDSDFSGGSASDNAVEEEQDEDEDESDDDFERPVRMRMKIVSKKTVAPKPKASRAATPRPQPRASGAPQTQNANNGSRAAPIGVDDESGAENREEEVYQGPTYRVEYAENGRASCKSCESKLERGMLRVGVRVRHSMFGITTYFKHVHCTQICWNAELENTEGDFNDQLRGLVSLQPKDREVAVAHMKKNAELRLLDERRELSEDQYTRKSRMPEKEPSPHLTATLLPYQREALAWMTAQEQSHYKGGILADEMGMGKTIQTISLILENPRDAKAPIPSSAFVRPPPKPKGKGKASVPSKAAFNPTHRGGTLVICPVVAVMQWKSEIERFVERDHFSIYVHHGTKRIDLVEKIASYDIVLTTYSIIENEVRKMLGWEKVSCKYCKKKYLPAKLVLHNKYFCGPNAKKTALQDRQQTKKKKGKKAAGEESESDDDLMKKPIKGKAKASARKGASKRKKEDSEDEDDDDDDDDVYVPQRKTPSKTSTMHQIYWTRIVLDEAHYIKDKQSNTARGVFELRSDYKWCLTGTPLQNRIGELFSLVRFLQIKFFAYYHCSKCECQMLDFNFVEGKCIHCSHNSMSHFSFFNKKIVVPIQSYGYVAEGKLAMLRLQNELLQHILLRRTKDGRADDISLPPKLIRIRRDRLDERENDFYQAIYTQSQAQFNTYVSSGTLLNNYAHIFDLLIRLRQAVDHPYLVIYSKSNPAIQLPLNARPMDDAGSTFLRPLVQEKPLVPVAGADADSDGEEPQSCGVCHEDVEDPVESACSHVFCRECVKEFIESLPDGAAATCPECDKPLTVDLSPPKAEPDDDGEEVDPHKPVIHRALVDIKRFHKRSILHRINDLDSFQTSTKIEALMQELDHMKVRDPSGKAIIFSQFVNMLDIIEHRLTIGGIKCVKLSGNMSMDVRDRTIRTFREDNSVTTFLISLKAGGVALNLTIASHIFLMDPWWNPAAENQAIDRTHRLGQFKPVQATRFIIAGTIEERILKLQQKKQLIFEGTVGGSVSAITRLTEEDLRFLFSK